MKYSVYQHWDPLKVCIVGKSYSPEFYSFIKNSRVRTVIERIAEETEEDYQKLIRLLEKFGVKVLRPNISNDYNEYIDPLTNIISPPPMTPRDYSIMLGNDFFFRANNFSKLISDKWEEWKGADWPDGAPNTTEEIENLPIGVKKEISNFSKLSLADVHNQSEFRLNTHNISQTWSTVIDYIKCHSESNLYNTVPQELHGFNAAMATRVGKDIYVGTEYYNQDMSTRLNSLRQTYPEYRWHQINSGGHLDGTFCPVVPGLIVSLQDIPTYEETFPNWEIVYLPGQSWDKVKPFLNLKEKNQGKWWVPGEELNDEFTEFVETWMNHWVGYVEETVFDVNMLVIDEKNVICNNYNEKVFKVFEGYGITPHVINFRHRYFWDGGLHCITSDIHREGTMKDYFPERN